MPATFRLLCVLALALGPGLSAAPLQTQDDPALQSAVQRFFATQEAEDVDGYLAQWSKTANRPDPSQLKYIFDSGDDRYSDIRIIAVRAAGDRVRARVSAVRERTSPPRVPGGPPRTFRSTLIWSLTFVREGDDWKLVLEAPAIDALAEDLIAAETPESRTALLDAEKDLVSPELISALARRAGNAAQMSLYRVSQTAFERMREVSVLLGDRKAEGEALQNVANALYFQRNMPAALSMYEERLAIERERDDPAAISQALLGIATIRYTFAEYGAALSSYQEALALQEKLGEESTIATTLISIGNVRYIQGEYSAAIADFTRSREISRRMNSLAGEADALEGMGRVLMAQGDYLGALDAFTDVLAEAKSRNHRSDQGAALLNIGDVHFRLGNIDSARRALDEARGHYEATKDLAGAGRAWQAVAITDLAANRFTLSEEEYKKSAAICAAASDRDCVASATVGLAFAQTAQDKFKDGIASYLAGIDAFIALNRREQAARARVGLAQAYLGTDAFADAAAAAVKARDEATAIANDDVLWRALVAHARALRRLRDRPNAVAAATAAVAAVDRLLEVARIRPSSPVARDSSAAFATLALLQAEDGDAASAFDTVERMRAHDLRVTLASGERDISRGMTDAEREEERTLAVELVALHAQLTREQTLPKPDAKRNGLLKTRIAGATAKREAQQEQLFARLPALRVWRGLAPAATHADATRVLVDGNSLLLELVVGDDTLLVLAARRNGDAATFSAYFEPADRKAMANRVAKLLGPASMSDPKQWNAAALELVPGLSAVIGKATRAIVVPHEVLWRVPFEALPTESGYVADTCSIVYAPSLTALVNADAPSLASGPVSRVEGGVVAVPAPALPAAAVEAIARAAPDWGLRTAADAAGELKSIAAAADPERTLVLAPEEATEALVRERLRFADVIEIAAPFRVNGASPLFSPMILMPDAANDGSLEPREIMNLHLEARLALFSDGGAMSMRDAADEVAAVAWAWRAAGVQTIVLPRWTSDAAALSAFVGGMHERLRAHEPAEAAVAGIRAQLRQRGVHPSVWAAWMLVGR